MNGLFTNPAFIVMKAANEFEDKTSVPIQHWQTGFTYFKVKARGWFCLSSILSDFSRYIITWKLCVTMMASHVFDASNLAPKASTCDSIKVVHKSRLLSDNSSPYISADLANWSSNKGIVHTRDAPMRPEIQGEVERWLQTRKKRILLEYYSLPSNFEQKIADFSSHCNHLRYHESVANLILAGVCFGRGQTILLKSERIKHQTFKTPRLVRSEKTV